MAVVEGAAPRRPRASWRPLRIYERVEALGVTRSKVYGYRAECSCGFEGKVHRDAHLAIMEARWHTGTHESDAGA